MVAAARSGDEVAFARLLEAEAPRAYPAVLAVVRTPEDAQEVIQDASIRAWRRIGGLRDDDRWAAWFRRIAIRLMASFEWAPGVTGFCRSEQVGETPEPASS